MGMFDDLVPSATADTGTTPPPAVVAGMGAFGNVSSFVRDYGLVVLAGVAFFR